MNYMVLKKSDELLDIKFKGSKSSLSYIKKNTFKYDDKGVLLYKIPYTNKFDYYPIHMARFSLGNLEVFLEKKEKNYEKIFLDQVNWLFNNLSYKDDFAIWEHNYTFPFYNFNRTPWAHGLGQGLGMIALLKAYQITDDKKYFDAVFKVLNSFDIEIEKGGVKFVDESGNVWFEEYAINPPPHVLNGLITILFCIYEVYRVKKNKQAKALYESGLKTVKDNLKSYDTGFWSYYDKLNKLPSTLNYHKMHIRQLKILYELSNDKIYKNYYEKWEKYSNKFLNRKFAGFNRGFYHLKRHGFFGSIKRFKKRRDWQNK